MKHYLYLACTLPMFLLLAGCVQRSSPPAGAGLSLDVNPLGPGVAYAADEAAGEWGTIKGQVVWADPTVPEPKEIDVSAHQDKAVCLCKGPVLSQDFVINKDNKGVANVVVWLVDQADLKKKLPIHPSLETPKDKEVVLDQPCCTFIPHAQGMREGQDLVCKNSAPIAHNVHWIGNPLKNPEGNVLIPSGSSHTVTDLKADRLPLKVSCNIHPWMTAWVGVYNHPYFAVTDADGKFEIKLAPAGKFGLVLWQESIGYRGGADGRKGTPITIAGGNNVTDLGQLDLKGQY